MNETPEIFEQSLKQHNIHCWIAAGLSLLGAVLGWMFFAAIYSGAVLLSDVIRTNDPGLQRPPDWLFPVGATIAGMLFLWAVIERWRTRFLPLTDRPIIGWHLVPEILLLPSRMTLAVWEHLTLRVHLNAWERGEAWRLLERISGERRVPRSTLSLEFPDEALLKRLLLALQLTGWIALHRGEEDWFYSLQSSAEENLPVPES